MSAAKKRAKRPASKPKVAPPEPVKKVVKVTDKEARKVADSPWLKRAARLGYAIRGVLYSVMGMLALGLVFGVDNKTVDQRGTLTLLPQGVQRTVVLLVVITALAAYAFWGFVRAIYDPLNRGSDAAGMLARLGFAWSGLNYVALVIFAATFLAGTTTGDGSGAIRSIVGSTLHHSGGQFVIVVAGFVATAAGFGQFWDAYKAGFRKDLKRGELSPTARHTIDNLGRFGMVARGVVFTLLGWFILQSGLGDDAAKTESIGQVFKTLAAAPLGGVLLSGVAVGFIALGVHSLALAFWVRMPKTSTDS